MGKHKKKQKKKWKIAILVILYILLFLSVGALIVVKLFTVEKVEVTGTKHYTEGEIESWLLNDEYSWNSMYVYIKYKFSKPRELPFVESMDLSLKSPHTLKVKVQDKALAGRVYVKTLGQNAYYDKDGIVVEMSSEVIKGVPNISGLDVDKIVLHEKLPIKGKSVLKNLLALTQMLKKYKLEPDSIKYGEEGSYTLKYGKLSVLLGQAENLNQKIERLSYIMPDLEEQMGTLHLESWTENTTDITFEKSD